MQKSLNCSLREQINANLGTSKKTMKSLTLMTSGKNTGRPGLDKNKDGKPFVSPLL